MSNWLTSAFSGQDNASIDIGRVLLTVSVVSFIGLEIFSVVVRGAEWQPMNFSGSLVGLLTGGSAALYIKRGTEPTPTGHPV